MGKPQEYYSTDRTKMAYFLPKQYQTVLEIGCGEGLFRTSLARGCEYWGIEPYAPAAAVASKGDGKILIGMFDEVFNQLPDHYFDLVVCNDVIEHMVDHDQFFESIKLKMKMDACLVGSVPNVRYIQNLFKLLFRRDW